MPQPQDPVNNLINWYDRGAKPIPGQPAAPPKDDLVAWFDTQKPEASPGALVKPPPLPGAPPLPQVSNTDAALGMAGSLVSPAKVVVPEPAQSAVLPQLLPPPGATPGAITMGVGRQPPAIAPTPQPAIPAHYGDVENPQSPSQIAEKVMTTPLGPLGPPIQQAFEKVGSLLKIPSVDIASHPVASEMIKIGSEMLTPEALGVVSSMAIAPALTAETVLAPYVHAAMRGIGAGFAIGQFSNSVDQFKQAKEMSSKADLADAAGNAMESMALRTQAVQLKVRAVSGLVQAALAAAPEAIGLGKKAMGAAEAKFGAPPVEATAGDAGAAQLTMDAEQASVGAQGPVSRVDFPKEGEGGGQAAYEVEPKPNPSASGRQTRYEQPPGKPRYSPEVQQTEAEMKAYQNRDKLDAQIENLTRDLNNVQEGSEPWKRIKANLDKALAEKARRQAPPKAEAPPQEEVPPTEEQTPPSGDGTADPEVQSLSQWYEEQTKGGKAKAEKVDEPPTAEGEMPPVEAQPEPEGETEGSKVFERRRPQGSTPSYTGKLPRGMERYRDLIEDYSDETGGVEEAEFGEGSHFFYLKPEYESETGSGAVTVAHHSLKEIKKRFKNDVVPRQTLERKGNAQSETPQPEVATPRKNAGDELLKHPFAKQIRAAELVKSGFITNDGRTIQLDGDHVMALYNAGLVNSQYASFNPFLAEHQLARVHVVKSSNSPEIALEFGALPGRLQLSSIRLMAEANPKATFSYDLYKDGKRTKSNAGVTHQQFLADVAKTYENPNALEFNSRDSQGPAYRMGNPASDAVSKKPAFEAHITPKNHTVYVTNEGLDLLKTIVGNTGQEATDMTWPRGTTGQATNRLRKNGSPLAMQAVEAINKVQNAAGRLRPIKIVLRPGEDIVTRTEFVMPKKRLLGPEHVEPRSIKETIISQRHEGNHVKMLWADDPGMNANEFFGELLDSPVAEVAGKAILGLKKAGYGAATVHLELLAHAISGDFKQMDITKDENVVLFKEILKAMKGQFPTTQVAELMSGFHPSLKETYERETRGGKRDSSARAMGARPVTVHEDLRRTGGGNSGGNVQGGAGEEGSGGEALERKRPSIEKHVTPEERELIKNEQKLYKAFDDLPAKADVQAAALAGAAGKYWYENSGRAIQQAVGKEDALQFSQLLAAFSPKTLITDNVRGAMEAWKQWNAAGRPTDEAALQAIMDSPKVHKYASMGMHKDAGIRVLQGQETPLEGLKVSSFTQNLIGNATKSTNDVHIARFVGVVQKVFADPEGYFATQALVRQVAQDMGWTPMQVQAAVWVWARPFYELAKKGASFKDAVRLMGPLSQQDIADFGSIMLTDPEVRSALDEVLKQRGTSLERFDKEFQERPLQYGTEETVPPKFSKAYEKRAKETVERERAINLANAEKKRLQDSSAVGQGDLSRPGLPPKVELPPRKAAPAGPAKKSAPKFVSKEQQPLFRKAPHLGGKKSISLNAKEQDIIEWALDPMGEYWDYPEGEGYTDNDITEEQHLPEIVAGRLQFDPESETLDDLIYRLGEQLLTMGEYPRPSLSDVPRGRDPELDGQRDTDKIAKALVRKIKAQMGPQVLERKKPSFTTPEYDKILTDRNRNTGPSLIDRILAIPHDLRLNYVDMFADIKDATLEAQKRGLIWAGAEDPYKVARIVYGGWGGPIESALLKYADIAHAAEKEGNLADLTQYLDLNGYLREWDIIRDKVTGLTAKINGPQPAGMSDHDWRIQKQEWRRLRVQLVGNLANNRIAPQGLDEATLQQMLTDAEAKVGPVKWGQLQAHAQKVYALTKDALDGLRQDRIISAGTYNELLKHPNHVSMRRILEDLEDNPYSPTAFSVKKQNVIFGMKGSALSNQNPMEATAIYHAATIRLRGRNWAAKTLANFKNIDPSFPIRKLRAHEQPTRGMGLISYMEDGKAQPHEVPTSWAEAVKVSNASEVNLIGRAVLGVSRSLLQKTATGWNLAFIMKNAVRDYKDARAFLPGSTPYQPLDAAKYGWLYADTIHKLMTDPAFKDAYLNSGVAYSTFQRAITPERFVNAKRVLNPGHKMLDVAGLNTFVEEAQKATAWRYLTSQGMDPIDAIYFAREGGGSPDFGRKGLKSSQAGLIEPFFNPAIQGAARDLKFISGQLENPTNSKGANLKKLIWYAGGVALSTLAIARYNAQFKSVDDGQPEMTHVSDSDRQNYNVVFTGGTSETSNGQIKHDSIKVPKSHLEQMFRNPIEVMVNSAMGIEHPSPTQAALTMLSSLLPGQINMKEDDVLNSLGYGMAASLSPVLKEPMQQAMNWDFLNQSPIVGKGMENDKPWLQYGPGTPQWAIKLAGAMSDHGVNVSPTRMMHLVQATVSGVGEQASTMADFLVTMGESTHKAPYEGTEQLTKIPVVGPMLRSFVGSVQDGKVRAMEEKFYKRLDSAGKEKQSFNDTLKHGNENPENLQRNIGQLMNDPEALALLALNSRLSNTSAALSQVRAAMRAFAQSNKLSDEAKKTALNKLWNGHRLLLLQSAKEEEIVVNAIKNDRNFAAALIKDAGAALKDELGLDRLFEQEEDADGK